MLFSLPGSPFILLPTGKFPNSDIPFSETLPDLQNQGEPVLPFSRLPESYIDSTIALTMLDYMLCFQPLDYEQGT